MRYALIMTVPKIYVLTSKLGLVRTSYFIVLLCKLVDLNVDPNITTL
jgi:hypothetical protein